MKDRKTKIGFCETGGIFVGKDIHSKFHKNYAVSVIIALDKPFVLTTGNNTGHYRVALIRKNIEFSIDTGKNNYVAFVHIVPHSEAGMMLDYKDIPVKKPRDAMFKKIVEEINQWFLSDMNDRNAVENIIRDISLAAGDPGNRTETDNRILYAIELITGHDEEKIYVEQIASKVNLSVSHFNRLLKKETGLTFRRFVLYTRLIRSIQAISNNTNLTEATFIGGFADQPHLSRTFTENFGIKPSKSIK